MFIYWCRKCTQQRRRCRWGVAAIYTRQTPASPPLSLFLSCSSALLLTWRIRNLRQAARNCIFNRFYIGFYSCSYIARVREGKGGRRGEADADIYANFSGRQKYFREICVIFIIKICAHFCSVFSASLASQCSVSFPLSLNLIWHEVSSGKGVG